MRAMRSLAPLLCTAVLCAQERSEPLRFVPAGADVVVRTIGPAAWRRDFAETKLAQALASRELEPEWDKLLGTLTDAVDLDAAAREQAAALWQLLRGHTGEVVIAVSIEWDAVSAEADAFPFAAVVAVGGDGATDLQGFAARLADLFGEAAVTEIELGSTTAPLRELGAVECAGPAMIDGSLVCVIGTDLAERAGTFFANDDGAAALPSRIRNSAFGAHLVLKPAIEAFLKLMKSEEMGPEMAPLFDLLGVRALKTIGATMYPDGRFVGQELAITLEGGGRGVFDVMMPLGRTRPGLLRYLPAGAGTYRAGPIDARALENLYARAFGLFADVLPITREQLEAQFTTFTRLDLVADVLGQIGSEYLRVDDAAAALDPTEELPEQVEKANEQFSNACFVVRLQDGARFGKDLDTAIRARGLHVGRKREDYAGTRIHRMNLLGMFPIEYAVTGNLFVLGVGDGEGTQRNVRGVLDAVVAEANGAAAPGLAAPVTSRLEGWPEGWSGIDVASLGEALEGVIGSFEGVEAMLARSDLTREDVEDPWWLVLDAARALKPILERHGVETSVSVDYMTKDRYLMRTRW